MAPRGSHRNNVGRPAGVSCRATTPAPGTRTTGAARSRRPASSAAGPAARRLGSASTISAPWRRRRRPTRRWPAGCPPIRPRAAQDYVAANRDLLGPHRVWCRRARGADRAPDGRGRRGRHAAAVRRAARRPRRHPERRGPRRLRLVRQFLVGPRRCRARAGDPVQSRRGTDRDRRRRRTRRADHAHRPRGRAHRRPGRPRGVPGGAGGQRRRAGRYSTYVDARDGGVLVREDLVDHARSDNPEWEVFPNSPRTDYCSPTPASTGAGRAPRLRRDGRHVGLAAAPGTSTRPPACPPTPRAATTRSRCTTGTAHDPFTVGTETATPRADRDYDYPWTNQWYERGCDPAVFTSPSATTSTPPGPTCSACTTACTTGPTTWASPRTTWNMQDDNFGTGRARQRRRAGQRAGRRHRRRVRPASPPGTTPTRSRRRTAPRRSPTCTCGSRSPGTFYAPCVDGDYDMSVIAHEYGHAITGRMIAGPNAGVSSPQGMSESWSDQLAMEYLFEHGYAPPGHPRATRSASTSPRTRSPASATTT